MTTPHPAVGSLYLREPCTITLDHEDDVIHRGIWLRCDHHGPVANLGESPSIMDAVRAEALHVKTASGGGGS